MILARFVQIHRSWFCEEFSSRVIRNPHSFLPTVAEAHSDRPAFECGVKLIGATLRFANRDLTAGPIIERGVRRVQYDYESGEFVRFHVRHRILVHGGPAIVFRD